MEYLLKCVPMGLVTVFTTPCEIVRFYTNERGPLAALDRISSFFNVLDKSYAPIEFRWCVLLF